MAVNEDLSAYSTSAASNTPASGSNVGPDLDNHLRDIKRNVRRVAERYQGATTPEAFRGREWLDTSGTAATKLELTMNDGSNEIPYMDFDTSAGTARPIIDGTTVPADSMALQGKDAVDIGGGAIDGTPIGGTTPAAGEFTTLETNGDANIKEDGAPLLSVTGYSSAAAGSSPYVILKRARGTESSSSAVLDNDVLGRIVVRPYDDAGFTTSDLGSIRWSATENHTATNHGTEALFHTTPNGTETPTLALTIGQDQSATFAAAVDVTGSLGVTGNITAGGPVYLKSYTVATLPTATTDGMIVVSDETGGLTPAFSDGTNWRRTSDRAIVS